MAQPGILIYGADWCGDCRRAKAFMDEHDIPYKWVDVQDDTKATELVMKLNNGKRIIPTIVFDDGSILVEPTNAELAKKLSI